MMEFLMDLAKSLGPSVVVFFTAWYLVNRLINLAASQVPEGASGIELSKKVIEMTADIRKTPTDEAIEFIKKEITVILE